MALAGRKPKPTVLRILEGNREHRQIKEPVKVPPIAPKMPLSFKGRKATLWKYYIEKTSKVPGWLTEDNAGLLAAYVVACVTHDRLDKYIEDKGGEHKYLEWCQKNNYARFHIMERDKAAKDINSFGAALGFQPTSRGRIEPADKKEEGEEDLD